MKERFETFTVLINKISRNIKKIKNQEMAEFGLRSTHGSCLYYLYCAEPLTAKELCERCEEDKATISRVLDFLEKNGYIICKPKSSKRYNSPVFLSEQGKAVGKKIADKISGVLDEIGVSLTEEKRVEFYRSLMIISDDLEQIDKNRKKGTA